MGKRKRPVAIKFQETMYVTAYQLARDGGTETYIAKTLGVSRPTFRRWCDRLPALQDAVDRGRAHGGSDGPTFQEYVYDHLPPHLRELWDDINECEDLENGIERIHALLKGKGKRARQHLFIYALTQSTFNVSGALRKVGLSRKVFEQWVATDPLFSELMDEIHWHKKNFMEQAFIGRIAAGDTHAIIHAVKTQCRDRGYNEKIEIEHSGTVTTEHTVNITELPLDIDTRKKVLKALRDYEAGDGGA